MTDPTLSADDLAVLRMLRMISSDADDLPPGLDPVTAAAALNWLLDNGYLTYRGAVGSEPVLTAAGLAYLDAHAAMNPKEQTS